MFVPYSLKLKCINFLQLHAHIAQPWHSTTVLGNTVEKVAPADSGIPRRFVKKAVDDKPTVSPAFTTWR